VYNVVDVADHISNVVRKHSLLDDGSTQWLSAVRHVSDALHANVLSCSVARSSYQRWNESRSKYTLYTSTYWLFCAYLKYKSINQSINTFITRYGTEARATVRIMLKQREMSLARS